MGVEIVANDSTSQAVEDTADMNVKLDQERGLEEPINFGLVDTTKRPNELTKAESDDAKNVSFPKDAVDEWPAPKQIHTFYFAKYQSYEDPKLKAKLEQVDKEIQKRNKERFQMTEALKVKRSERSNVISQLKPLISEDKQLRVIIDEKRKEMEPLHAALGKLRAANNAERGMGICSSEEELDNLIQTLHYRIQHESNTLAEEKQLLKDIKQLEGTRERVIAHAAMKAKLQDSLGPKEAIQDQVKMIGVDLVGVKKEQQAVRAKIRSLEEVLNAIDEDIASLQEELAAVTQRREKAYEMLNDLKKARDEGNAPYYQNRSLLNNARDLAAKKDMAALEELSNNEGQLSRDARMRNPDEKPIVSETVTSTESETLLSAGSRKVDVDVKPLKVDVGSSVQHLSSKKAQKDDIEKLSGDGTETKARSSPEGPETTLSGKAQKDTAAPEIDSAKLKEMKREEEMAKAKLALERKKKMAEKAAAKAAARAQKEAEKKQKEREKKAKKKAGAMVPDTPDEQIEVETEAEELQETEDDAQMPTKVQETTENVRYRTRSKGLDQRPKIVIPRRKRSHPYWWWAAPAAASALLLPVLGYYYYFGRN